MKNKVISFASGKIFLRKNQFLESDMKGSRPPQSKLTKDNDLSNTEETRRVVEAMVDGLNDHEIECMEKFFSDSFRWIGNAGCGFKKGLR